MKRLRQNRVKFLARELEARPLTQKEARQLDDLSLKMPDMGELMKSEAMCMNLLRESAIQQEPDASFNARVIRLWRVDRQKSGLQYWMPAACGAFVAILALLSIMRLMTTSTPETWKNHKSEARRVDTSNLILIDQHSAPRAK